jgi:hypothetical protein
MLGLSYISWVNMLHQQGGIANVEAPLPLPDLTDPEIDALRYPTTRYVLVLTQTPTGVPAALKKLRGLHLVDRIAQRGDWINGKLHYALVQLQKADE